jgi:hypothetical protein
MSEISEMINSAVNDSDKYFLQEQELWENLGFDWEGWNATVEKILQQKSAMSRLEKE